MEFPCGNFNRHHASLNSLGLLGRLRIAPARGPPLWELAEASALAGNDPEWNTAEPEPEIEFYQSVAW